MKAVLLSTIHTFQNRVFSQQFHRELENLIEQYGIQCVCEEMSEDARREKPFAVIGPFVEQVLQLKHIDMDMSYAQRAALGIPLEHESRRGTFEITNLNEQRMVVVRYPADDVREEWWIDQIEKQQVERVLVICAPPHTEQFCQKWLRRGHNILEKVFYMHQYFRTTLTDWEIVTEELSNRQWVKVELNRVLESPYDDFDRWNKILPGSYNSSRERVD